MEVRKIVVVVEEAEASRTALLWCLHNLFRFGDVITLLHVFSPPPRCKSKKARLLRLHGFQLALSFREMCSSNTFFNTNTEIIVREGDSEGQTIAAVVREIGASALLVGLHENSFLYRLAMNGGDIASSLNCKVLAIKQPSSLPHKAKTDDPRLPIGQDGSTSLDFSQIEISGLQIPEPTPPKVPYRLCPSPHAIIWRTRPRK